jgi:hypothetical protein
MRVYRLTHEDVRTTTEAVASMIKLKSHSIYALFDLGATHFFIASRIMNKLNLNRGLLEKGMVVGTPLGEYVDIEDACKECVVSIGGERMKVDLIPLKITDFDIILGMNCLSAYRVQMECFIKIVTFLEDDRDEMTFRGKAE